MAESTSNRGSVRRWLRCRQRARELERLARDLIDAVKAQDPELIGNDLGNAIDALEDELARDG